ncbi:MAG: GNAT family N-acetyltransferase [Pirellulaceae bacterium]
MKIRKASLSDLDTIVDFNLCLAQETEQKQLDQETVTKGVANLLSNPSRGEYFVAEIDDSVVGQLMYTNEWSDWRNGNILWIQSVYVHRDYRRRGVFRALCEHLHRYADESTDAIGLRLYVEVNNSNAQATYENLGFDTPGYAVMERLFR